MAHMNHPELEKLRRRLEIQAENLQMQLDETKRQLESVDTTIELLKQQAAIGADCPPALQVVTLSNELHGLTQLDAMVKIAKANGNRLTITTAKELLLRFGVTKSRTNANSIIFNVIKRSRRFRRINPGEYELIEYEDSSSDLREA